MTNDSDSAMTRRRFGSVLGGALAAAFGDGCFAWTRSEEADAVRLTARPRTGVAARLTSGALGVGTGERDGVVQVPAKLPDGAVPLLLFLHGATQSGAGMLRRIGAAADEAGVVVVAPDSRGTTWD